MFDTNEVYCRCQEGHTHMAGTNTAGDGEFHLRVDDQSTLFVNGEQIGETTGERAECQVRSPACLEFRRFALRTAHACANSGAMHLL